MNGLSDTVYQCKGCRLMWEPMRRSYLECPQCERATSYEALDTWCTDVNEIATDRLRNVIMSIVVGGALWKSHLCGHSRGAFRPSKDDPQEVKDDYQRSVWAPGRGVPLR